MYLASMLGFVEADRWDGNPVRHHLEHQAEIEKVSGLTDEGGVIVVRSRNRATVVAYAGIVEEEGSNRTVRVFKSPPGWDYQWRIYLTPDEWGECMKQVGESLDYRNYKSTCHARVPKLADLAHAIWDAAYEHDTN